MNKLTLGIDIGGTFIKFGIYLADGQEVFSDKIPTPKEAENFIDTLEEIIKLLKTKEHSYYRSVLYSLLCFKCSLL